jgi:hypothetical protein
MILIKEGRCFLNQANRHRFASTGPDEVLIADVRAYLTPTDMVEHKLQRLLIGASRAGRPLGLETTATGRGDFVINPM